jgi:hypothetical protein
MSPTTTAVATPGTASERNERQPYETVKQAGRTILAVLSAWTAERTGVDPVYLGVLLLASVELGVQRMLGK